MSVSPPPGGSIMPAIALGGGPGVMIRKVWPPSTDPSQTLRCVPVPVGPLTKTFPKGSIPMRSEEHTSQLQSQSNLVCRLLLEKKKKKNIHNSPTSHS